MPYKFNQSCRPQIAKAKYRVTDRPEYDAALVRRGSLTVWLTEEAIAAWQAPAIGRRGGQPIYPAIAIETSLALRRVLHQSLRQTEGLPRSIADVLGINIAIPDHATLSRGGDALTIVPKRIDRAEPQHLLRCFATTPSSVDDFTPAFCPINGPRQKSGAMCSTG